MVEELDGFGATGQAVVRWFNLKQGTDGVAFYLDADLQSGTAILTVPNAQLGIDPAKPLRFSVLAYDNYVSGFVTDAIPDMTHTPARPRYRVEGDLATPIASRGHRELWVDRARVGAAASPSRTGLLVMCRRNAGARPRSCRSAERGAAP